MFHQVTLPVSLPVLQFQGDLAHALKRWILGPEAT
jgi:hypothetical protein